ncbi:MAG: peroxidase family protein [Gemmataceae bacterium]
MHSRPMLNIEELEVRNLLSVDLAALLGGSAITDYSVDGSGNNADNADLGSTGVQLLRITSSEYADGISAPAGADRLSAREISNLVAAQDSSIVNDRYLTDLVWLWGQFIDHDIDLTEGADPAEPFDIAVPTGDPQFDPFNTGTQTIGLNRSVYDETTGITDPRQQINEITAFLDGSVVYGSDQERADALRAFTGGLLATSAGDLLPFNEAGLPNAGGTSSSLFLAGDVRANENAALTSMQTLWVREHNRIATEIAGTYFAGADLSDPAVDEEIYQRARAIVIAEIQSITFNEFLPALLGQDAIPDYQGYDPNVDPGIANIFSTAAYRFGHSMLSPDLLLLNADGSDAGTLALRDAFFAPNQITANGIDAFLLGAANQQAQEIDSFVVDDVRNFLFGPPGAGGFDLASLNIQRGRDHGLPDYNQARIDLGLAPVTSFADISSDPEVQARLAAAYDTVDDIDVWVGALAEDHLPGSSVGELIQAVLVDQFTRIRDGDANWYQNVLSGRELEAVENTTLADVIRRNTEITAIQDNVFYAPSVIYLEAGNRGGDFEVVVNNDEVRVLDGGRLIESRPLSAVDQIILVGSDRDDRFTVQASPSAQALAGGILVYGEEGRDSLTLQNTRGPDTFVVNGPSVNYNGQSITYDDLERLTLEVGRGDDVDVEEKAEARLDILRDGDRRDGDGGRDRDDPFRRDGDGRRR